MAYREDSSPGDTVDATIDEGEVFMPSRLSREERIQKDLDELLGQLAILAKALLIRNGEFFPFGATIGKKGKFSLVTPVPESDRPTAQDVVDAVLSEVKGSRGSLRACGVAAMAATSTDADAVRIELEHSEGSSLVIALPYARGDFGAFAYGDMEAHLTERRIWTPDPVAPARPSKPATRAKAESKTMPAAKSQPADKVGPKRGTASKSAKTMPKPETAMVPPPRDSRQKSVAPAARKTRNARASLATQPASLF